MHLLGPKHWSRHCEVLEMNRTESLPLGEKMFWFRQKTANSDAVRKCSQTVSSSTRARFSIRQGKLGQTSLIIIKIILKTSLNLKDQGSEKPRRLRTNYSTLISFCLEAFLSLGLVEAWVYFEMGRKGGMRKEKGWVGRRNTYKEGRSKEIYLLFFSKKCGLYSHKSGHPGPLPCLSGGCNACGGWKQVTAANNILRDVDYEAPMPLHSPWETPLRW